MSECYLTEDTIEFLKMLQKDTREYAGCITQEGIPKELPIYGQSKTVAIPVNECYCVFHTHPVGSPNVPSATDVIEQFKKRGTSPSLLVSDRGISEFKIENADKFKKEAIEKEHRFRSEFANELAKSEEDAKSFLNSVGIKITKIISQ